MTPESEIDSCNFRMVAGLQISKKVAHLMIYIFVPVSHCLFFLGLKIWCKMGRVWEEEKVHTSSKRSARLSDVFEMRFYQFIKLGGRR